MSIFSTSTTINAPVQSVWAALADIGNIQAWNPGVKESHKTTEASTGLGACRFCDLGAENYLNEEVVTWEIEHKITFRITSTNLPFESADIRFTLQEQGDQTLVDVSPEYELKYGIFGNLLDKIYVGRSYKQGMDALLAGLKEYVEDN